MIVDCNYLNVLAKPQSLDFGVSSNNFKPVSNINKSFCKASILCDK